ncbi:4Fe-4S binding protein [[Eubacterium] cellulosolvens]
MSEEAGWKSLVMAGVVQAGTAAKYRTGDWRTFKPVIDKNKCIGCLICWIDCPEPSITQVGEKVEIDYEYCKGCGICAEECPVKAITMEEE